MRPQDRRFIQDVAEIDRNIARLMKERFDAEQRGDTRRAHFITTRHLPSWTHRPAWRAYLLERKHAESDMAFEPEQFTRSTDMDHGYVAEASTLGLPPGSWPSSFYLDGMLFIADRAQRGNTDDGFGEIIAMQYQGVACRAFATILND